MISRIFPFISRIALFGLTALSFFCGEYFGLVYAEEPAVDPNYDAYDFGPRPTTTNTSSAEQQATLQGNSILGSNFKIDPNDLSPGTTRYAGGTKSNINQLLTALSRLLLTLLGIMAVVLIIVGGLRMAISGGNSDEVSKGTYMIKYNIYAIIVALSSYVIIQLVSWILS